MVTAINNLETQNTVISIELCLQGVSAHVVADSLVVEDTLNAADGTHGNILVPYAAVGEFHDILLGDLANGTLNVLSREATASGDDLATNVLSNGSGAVKREEDRSLELSLSTLDLSGRDVEAQACPFTESEVDQFIEAGQVLGDKVDTPETKGVFFFLSQSPCTRKILQISKNSPSVTVASGETHEAVGEALVVDVGAELAAKVRGVTHGTVPVANNGLRDQAGEVVVVLPAHTLNGEGNVGRGESVITESDFGANELGGTLLLGGEGLGSGGWGLAGEATEVLLSQSDELFVGDTTSTNQNHAVSGVVGLDVVDQVVPVDGLDVLLGTEDGATKRLALESSGVKVVENNLLELLVNLLLLTQDDVPLTLNGTGLQLRVLKDVCEDVDGLGDIVVEGLRVVDGVFPLEAAISSTLSKNISSII